MNGTLLWTACVVVVALLSIFVVSRPIQRIAPHILPSSPISSSEKIMPMSRTACADLVAWLKAYNATPKGQKVLPSEYYGQVNKITLLTHQELLHQTEHSYKFARATHFLLSHQHSPGITTVAATDALAILGWDTFTIRC